VTSPWTFPSPEDTRARLDEFRERHPHVTVLPGQLSAVWFDDDGVHRVERGTPADLLAYLVAWFGLGRGSQ
jgi:hypothetical protein